MTPLASELDRYLATRRGLGFALDTAERVLRRFVAFVDGQKAEHVTTRLFLQWKGEFGRAGNPTWAARLRVVRLFAQWLHGLDARHEVPPP